jgi:monofunctional biosynthetic peptidoglycan transglycosylase
MRLAVLVGEDARFFVHGGLDWVEVRDALQDAIQKHAAPRGASTITQQLARNLWLSPSRNPLRKMKEMVLAVQLERSLSKERILELYLNVAQFGPSQFGVEAAARRFFAKPAAELNELEAAQLAAALPAASSWYPGSESEAYQERIDAIISRMHSETWLTDWI